MPHPVLSEPSWTLVPHSEPPKYTRPLQGAELLHDCSGRMNDGLSEVVMGATFKTSLSNAELESRAHEAIGRMRFIIPILASAIQADPSDPFSSSFIYTVPRDQADLHAWISSTLTIRHGPFDPEAFVAEMNGRKLPYVHADGHEQPSHFYLLVDDSPVAEAESRSVGENLGERIHGLFHHGPHTLMDARPTLRCLDALLGWIADPPSETLEALAWGEEWKSLPVPPIAATGGIRDDWDTEGVKLMQEMTEMLMHPVPTHSLRPPRSAVVTPGKMIRVHAVFDRDTSGRIVRATKSLGFTPSALFDAAVCLVTFARNPVKPEDAATAHFTFDPTVIAQDRYLVPPHTGLSHFIAGLALVSLRIPYASIPFSASRRDQIISVMSQLKSQLDHYLQNPNLPHVLPAQLAYHPPRMAKDISNPHVSITSNLGNVSLLLRSKEKTVEVVDMVFGHRLPWQRIMFHCWSLNGEMRLQVQASDVWDEPLICSYLDDVKNLMLTVLDSPHPVADPAPPSTSSISIPAPIPDSSVMPFPGDHFTPTTHHAPYPAIAPHSTDLAGRVIFVSNASSSVGHAASLALVRGGAAGLVLTAREASLGVLDELEGAILQECRTTKVLKLTMDVRDASSIRSAVEQTRETFGTVDTLLNIAGYIDATVPISVSDPDDWWSALETNVRGTLAVTQAVLPLMKDSASETKYIVNYSSVSAHYTNPQCSGYAISKLALLRLSEILSVDLSSSGITVLAIHPGTVRSGLTLRSVPSALQHMLIDAPELSADSVVWLVKERRDWLNGRFVSCTWDMPELLERKDEVVGKDLLKVKFSF